MEHITIVIDDPTGGKTQTAKAAKLSAEISLYGSKPPMWPRAFAQIWIHTKRPWSASEIKFALAGVVDGLRSARIIKQTGVIVIDSINQRRAHAREFIAITLTKNKP